jgi:hypothetical protein
MKITFTVIIYFICNTNVQFEYLSPQFKYINDDKKTALWMTKYLKRHHSINNKLGNSFDACSLVYLSMLTQLHRLHIEKENNLQVIRWNGYGTNCSWPV